MAVMPYRQWLAATRKPANAASAVEWLRSGHAPAGTVIPEALRPQFGGAYAVTGPATGAPSSFNMATVPATDAQGVVGTPTTSVTTTSGTPTLPTPQNPYLPQMLLVGQQLQNLGATYNPQRQALAASTAAQLAASGLVDFPAQGTPRVVQGPNGPQVTYDYTQAVGQAPNAFGGVPDVQYGVVRGADGRAYLQAFTGVAHGAASRGVFSGSQVDAQQGAARLGLDLQRQQAYTNLQAQQAQVTGQEQNRVGELSSSWADYLSKASQEVPTTVGGWSTPPQTTTTTTNPSPLTQLTGGQNTVTGSPGGTAKPQVKAVGMKPITSVTKTKSPGGGLTIRKLGL